VRAWLIAVVWVAWFVVTAGSGYAGPAPGDRVDVAATRASVRADLVTIATLSAAVVIAVSVPATELPGDPVAGLAIGAVLVVAGLALRRWAAAALGPAFTRSIVFRRDHRVIDTGPYRIVRHPGYTGVLVSTLGLGLTLWNGLSLLVALAGYAVAHVPRIKAEEAALEAQLGDRYRAYARTRRRLVPGIW
jgi:protein-S-isoprenylcysteine O-methyltransferase Ste14